MFEAVNEWKEERNAVLPNDPVPQDILQGENMVVLSGRHTLSVMMKRMSMEAQLKKDFTNHGPWAYGVTKLFKVNVPEKLITEQSGHRSLEGLHQYERTDMARELQVCKVLAKSPSESRALRPIQQPLPLPPPAPVVPKFSGCTFTNSVFQLAAPIPV